MYFVALVMLGRILFYKKDFDEAVVHLESGLSILREELASSPCTANGTNVLHWCCHFFVSQSNIYHRVDCRSVLSCMHCDGAKQIDRGTCSRHAVFAFEPKYLPKRTQPNYLWYESLT